MVKKNRRAVAALICQPSMVTDSRGPRTHLLADFASVGLGVDRVEPVDGERHRDPPIGSVAELHPRTRVRAGPRYRLCPGLSIR